MKRKRKYERGRESWRKCQKGTEGKVEYERQIGRETEGHRKKARGRGRRSYERHKEEELQTIGKK